MSEMFLLDRYIARQVLFSTVIAVLILSVLLVLGNIFKQILGLPTEVLRQMPMSMLVEFIGYAWLASLPFTVPWALLTAVLLTMGRLSADNELLGMRMAGRSLLRIAAPIWIIGILCTLGCLFINVVIAPQAARQIKQLPAKIATIDPKLALRPQQVNAMGNLLFYIGERKGDRLLNFHSVMLNEKFQPTMSSFSRRVEMKPGSTEREINLDMHNGLYLWRSAERPSDVSQIQGPLTAGTLPQSIGMHQLFARLDRVKPSMMTQKELQDALKAKMEVPSSLWNKKVKGQELTPKQEASSLRTEMNHRISFSLACIVFVLVAIPLGITAQRRETAAGFGISVVIGLIYFSLLILGNNIFRTNAGARPWLLVWLPNLIFLATGGWLFWRHQRR